MTCSICGRSTCMASFHRIDTQFAAMENLGNEVADIASKAIEERDRLRAINEELVKALEGALDFAESVEAYDAERTGEYDALPDPRVDSARLVLAKAKGEQ